MPPALELLAPRVTQRAHCTGLFPGLLAQATMLNLGPRVYSGASRPVKGTTLMAWSAIRVCFGGWR
jgi:hypothetical protein